MFSSTVRTSSSVKACGSQPVISSRRRVNAPASGARSPAAMRRKVDLPQPLRPTRPMRSLSLIAMVARSRTVCGP